MSLFNKKRYKGELGKFTYDKREYKYNSDSGFMYYIGKSEKPSYLKGCINYSFLFASRRDLEVIDLSGWDITNVKYMLCMFAGCSNLKKIIGIENWDTSNTIDATSMYFGCPLL